MEAQHDIVIKQIKNISEEDVSHLIEESRIDGFRFLKRLIDDYNNSTNTFNKQGEALYGVYNHEGLLIAIGGLNQDPYSNSMRVGRLRRFYVSKKYRRLGIGKKLVETIIDYSREYYDDIVLNTDSDQADKFYTSLGFLKQQQYPNSTHYMKLKYQGIDSR
jgi:GNAT superfamily N-acetyltransferase